MVRIRQKNKVYRNFDSGHLTKWEKVISKIKVKCCGSVKFLSPWVSNNSGHPWQKLRTLKITIIYWFPYTCLNNLKFIECRKSVLLFLNIHFAAIWLCCLRTAMLLVGCEALDITQNPDQLWAVVLSALLLLFYFQSNLSYTWQYTHPYRTT